VRPILARKKPTAAKKATHQQKQHQGPRFQQKAAAKQLQIIMQVGGYIVEREREGMAVRQCDGGEGLYGGRASE